MGDRSNPDFVPHDDYPTKGYAVSGKIMLSAIVILFAVVIVMVCLHLYARWYLIRARRRQLRNRRRTHIVFYVDPNNPAAATSVTVPASRGLDASVLKSLPVFVYSSETHPEESLECAVCLSEFEENEKGRTLVKCNHSFHIDCIDMWFHSHSTCPLCRSPVEPDGLVPENREDEVVVTVNEPVETTGNPSSGSSSELCSSCKHGEEGTNRGFWSSSSSSSTAAAATARASTSSFGARRKALEMMGGVSIEVPRRNQENSWRSEDEFMTESPASLSFKSPTGGRIRSLKRILSRGLLSPSSGAAGTSCGTGSEFDLERGRDESSTPRSRVGTPRFGGDVSK